MPAPADRLVALLRRAAAPLCADAELLRAYADRRDAAAFRQLVARHGPLVLGVCRRALDDEHAAEDAFQATFLVLARRPGAVRQPEALAAWLFGVARRICARARRSGARRRAAEARAPARPPAADPATELTARELLAALDEELARLPESERGPLALVFWQGLAQTEAARRLGLSLPALRGRLDRGRKRLADRLTHRGFAPSAVLAAPLATAAVPRDLLAATAALASDPWSKALPAAVLALAAAGTVAKVVPAVAIGVLAIGVGLAALGRAGSVSDPNENPPPVARAATPAAEQPEVPRLDRLGDPLPPGAVQRLGTVRYHTGFPIQRGNRIYLRAGKTLLTFGFGAPRWFDADSGRETDFWNPPDGLSVNAVSPDGRLALLTDPRAHATIRVWDLTARKELRTFEVPGQGRLVPTFAPDRRHVAVPDQGRLRLWDVAAGKELWQREGVVHPDRPEGVIGFRPDGRTLVTQRVSAQPNQRDCEIFILDRATGQIVGSFAIPESTGQSLTPDGKGLLARTNRPPILFDVWDLETSQRRFRLGGDLGINRTGPSAFSLGGTRLVTPGPGTTGNVSALVWEWPSGKLLRRIELRLNQLDGLGFTPDGKRVEATTAGQSLARYYDVETGQPLPPLEGHVKTLFAARFVADGTVLTFGEDRVAWFWDPATGQPLRRVPMAGSTMQQLKFVSADGRMAVTGASMTPPQFPVEVCDSATGHVLHTIAPQGVSVLLAAITPDGRLLATSWDTPNVPGMRAALDQWKRTRLWEVASGRELRQVDHPHCTILAFSPDGRFLATAGDDGVRVWNTTSGRLASSLQGDMLCLAFAPDGRTLACVTARETVGLELASGNVPWRVVTPEIQALGSSRTPPAFAPDGRRLALSDGFSTMRVWDVESGQVLHTLIGHGGNITSTTFARDGRTLLTSSQDTTALLWATPAPAHAVAALTADQANAAWADLAQADAAVAFRALTRLRDTPARSVPLLRTQLLRARPPAPAVDIDRVARLFAALDDQRFEVRERATRDLAALGMGVAPALRRLLADSPTPEARRRAEEVLAKLEEPAPDAELLQDLRGVEILEAIATSEARAILEELAKRDAGARLTRDAKASLDRLKR